MMKKFRKLSVIAALSAVSFSANSADYKCDQMVQKTAFEICYNYGLKNPLWVRWDMKKSDLVKKGFDRKGVDFHEEAKIPKRYRSTLADYKRSGYDRGHMAENAAFDHDRKLQKETFSLANITPEHPKFNRGIKRYSEALFRKLAISNGHAKVLTGNVFPGVGVKRIGPGGVAVPSHGYKIVYFPKTNKTVSLLIPHNNESQGRKPSKFKVDIKVIEKMTGFNLRKLIRS